METAKLVLEFLRVIAWPTTVVGLMLVFRVPIRTILHRLRKAELPGGVSIDFQEEIQQAKKLSEKVEALPTPADRPKTPALPITEANARMLSVGLRPTSSGLDMNYYREIANSDPNLALAGLRIELETMANNVAQGFNIARRKNESLNSLLSRLSEHGAITNEQRDLMRKILSLCNQAVHGRTVTKAEADEVINAASVIADQYLEWLSWGFPGNWAPKSASAN
jgi:Domain of unknown function (DUF4145)